MKNKNPYIIAEIASAHQGKYNNVIKIAEAANKAGADFVKLQIFNLNDLIDKNHKDYSTFKKISINSLEWEKTIKGILKKNIKLIIEPYDLVSLKIATKFKRISSYKIPASSLNDEILIIEALKNAKKLYLGVGGSNLKEINNALKLTNSYPTVEIVLVCGIQNFPTQLNDSNLWQIKFLKTKFKKEICYADHMDGAKSDEASTIPAIAYLIGANYIEKHITMNRSKKGYDYYSSLEPKEFKKFVELLKQINILITNKNSWLLSKNEINYRNFSKKYGLIKNDISKGHSLSKEDVFFVRSNKSKITEKDLYSLIGKRTIKKLSSGTGIKKEYFK